MTRLLVTRGLPDNVINALEGDFDLTLRDIPRPLSQDEVAQALMTYDAILPTLGDDFGADSFAGLGAHRCKLLANFGVGYNHINVSAAARHNIAVTNTPGAVTDATADIALTLMLMSCRRAAEGERLVRAGKWAGWHPTQMLGMHMSGKVLGIIGMGRIGKAIAKRAHAGFGMDIVFHNRSAVQDAGVPAKQLDSLSHVMRTADIVVLAVPATPETHHLIGASELAALQPHAHLINIARGDIVDEAVLIDALQKQKIAGAGLDVYEHEPDVPEALRVLDNVTLLPHLGTAALEVREAMGMMAVDNLKAFFAGQTPPNLVMA